MAWHDLTSANATVATEFSVNRPIFILQGGIVVVSGCYSYLGKNTMAGQNFLGVASIDAGVRARFAGCDFAGLVQGTPLIDDAFTGAGAPPVVQGVSLSGTGAIHPTSEVGAGVVGTRITSVTSAMSPYSLKPLDDLLIVNSTSVTITVDAMQTIVGKVYKIKARASNVPVTIATPLGTQRIDGLTTQTISTAWGFMEIVTDGSNWFIVSKG